jgi:NADPH:quinone reductase-like Zn-dependent oxidoreductase
VEKIVIQRPGGHHKLQIMELPSPTPQNDEVLVEVGAAGVNFADVFIRLGLYKSAKEFVGWPITPGFEFSGKVIQCGRNVSDLAEGTPVFGLTRFGGYSSHLCVPREQVFLIPPGSRFSNDQWAAFPTVFLTAYHGLYQNPCRISCSGLKKAESIRRLYNAFPLRRLPTPIEPLNPAPRWAN